MNVLGNILWFVFGGFFSSLGWFLSGCIWCITILGIPIGLQCFKFAKFTLWPFGKEILYGEKITSFLLNVLWILFTGFWLALYEIACGILLCVTIIGIPFGLQHFKLAKLSFMPFGSIIVDKII